MKKSHAIVLAIIVGTICIMSGMFIGEKLASFKEATIVGNVYFDTNGNFALDYGDIAADGVKLALHSEETEVNEVTVDKNGEYRFEGCKEGEYCINVVFQTGPYQLQYNATYFFGDQSVNVQRGKGELIIGPTILLSKGGMG